MATSRARRTPRDDAFLDRAWLAWHAMPRKTPWRPPSWRSIELEHNLAEGTFSKLFKGHRTEHALAMLYRLAAALHVSPVWLIHGAGSPPATPYQVPPRDAPVARGEVERAITTLRRSLLRGGVPAREVRAAAAAAGAALRGGEAASEDDARAAAVDFARANGVPEAAKTPTDAGAKDAGGGPAREGAAAHVLAAVKALLDGGDVEGARRLAGARW